MSKMAELNMDIHYLLDTTRMTCQEVADTLGCPVDWVNEIVEQRWQDVCNETAE
jgi:predicted XRE-type DNA-binding protein